jgi:hypothetical protein
MVCIGFIVRKLCIQLRTVVFRTHPIITEVSCSLQSPNEASFRFNLEDCLYINIATCMSDYRFRFGLMIRFIGHFDTDRDYVLQFTITHTYTQVPTVTSSLAVAR